MRVHFNTHDEDTHLHAESVGIAVPRVGEAVILDGMIPSGRRVHASWRIIDVIWQFEGSRSSWSFAHSKLSTGMPNEAAAMILSTHPGRARE